MPEPVRRQREVALFDELCSVGVTFALELRNDAAPPTAFRLGWVHAAIRELDPAAYETLIEPVRSFVDDVTTGEPGTNGRPLLFAASSAEPDDASRTVWLRRPAQWAYRFEGVVTELATPAARRDVQLRLRDSFAVFESGRVFYLLTLTQPTADVVDPLDEYAVLQLQQLVIDLRSAGDPSFLGFARSDRDAASVSVLELAAARLYELANDHGHDSAIDRIIVPFGLLGSGATAPIWQPATLPAPGAPRAPRASNVGAVLRGLCLAIEDEGMLAVADFADRIFADGVAVAPQPPPSVAQAALEQAWTRAADAVPDVHHDLANDRPRALLAFSGVAQAVPDFPWQDESEIHDATRPSFRSVESACYVHPRFVLEVGERWRSFRNGRDDVGTCPYLLLMWIVAMHDELMVQDMEAQLSAVVYGRPAHDATSAADLVDNATAEPLGDVRQVVATAKHLLGGRTDLLERNLTDRLHLFRWHVIHRSGTLFRYPKEKGALEAIQATLGTKERFERALATLDRIESLVEDVVALKSTYAERRTNAILLMLALLGVVGVSSDLYGYVGLWSVDRKFAALTAVLTFGLALVLVRERVMSRQRRRRRGSPRR